MTFFNKIFFLILCFGFAVSISAKERPYIKTKTKTIVAETITSDSNGVLTYKAGPLRQKIKPKEYIYARIPRPNEITSALRKFKSKQYIVVSNDLNRAYNKYRYVGWDIFCIYYSGEALAKAEKVEKAIAKLEMIKAPPIDPKKMKDYYNAKKLLATLYIKNGVFDKAEKTLALIGQADDPVIFAFVNNARGDILSKKGKTKDAALMYLRTIMFCTKDNNKKERPEALSKVINILKEAKNNRYLDFEKTLKSDYPDFQK